MNRIQHFLSKANPWMLSIIFAAIALIFQQVLLNFLALFIEIPEEEPEFGIVVIVLYAIIAPLIETLLFQALIIENLIGKIAKVYIITISAFIFSIFHFASFVYVLAIFPVGIMFAYEYILFLERKEKAFWLTALTHSVFNIVAIIQSYIILEL